MRSTKRQHQQLRSVFFHPVILIVCLWPPRAQTRLWPSVWRPTTASTTWWRPPPKPWGSGWMSSWRAPKATRSSWAEGPAVDRFRRVDPDVSCSRAAARIDRRTLKETDDLQEAWCLQANEGFRGAFTHKTFSKNRSKRTPLTQIHSITRISVSRISFWRNQD